MSDLTISAAELRAALAKPDAPVLLDVRRKPTFDAAPSMIAGAQWHDPYQVGAWVDALPAEREVIVYCAHGLEIGRGVRDLLASIFKPSGRKVRYLQGGIEQWELSGGKTVAKQSKP